MVHRLIHYLKQNNVPYKIIYHPLAFTAQDIAHVTHISGKEIAKVVMVEIDDILSMVVLPATKMIDFDFLKRALQAEKVELASEALFNIRFSDCVKGAMPPFGNLYHIPVYVDKSLKEDEMIAFNAGHHRELVKMCYSDFERLVKPEIIDVGVEAHAVY